MYLLIRKIGEETDYFGPFPTEERAKKYAEQFESPYLLYPLIVPNCVQVKLVY